MPELTGRRHLPSLKAKVMVIPIFVGPEDTGHFSSVIRLRLPTGKVIYYHMDSEPSCTGNIKATFQQTAAHAKVDENGIDRETLWSNAPGTTEWHRIQVPQQARKTLDCAPLSGLYMYRFLTSLYRKDEGSRISLDEDRKIYRFALKTGINESEIGLMAREWMQKSIKNGQLQRGGRMLKYLEVCKHTPRTELEATETTQMAQLKIPSDPSPKNEYSNDESSTKQRATQNSKQSSGNLNSNENQSKSNRQPNDTENQSSQNSSESSAKKKNKRRRDPKKQRKRAKEKS